MSLHSETERLKYQPNCTLALDRGRMSTSIRWTKYDGERIEAAGHRTFIERGPTIRFGNPTRIYGYVWPKGERFCAYYETEGRGETVDVELGSFDSQQDARRAVEKALGLR